MRDTIRTSDTMVDLATVESALDRSPLRLGFEPSLERIFRRDTAASRVYTSMVTSIFAIVGYDVFLLNDWNILHDQFDTMVVARLGIFTPIAVAIIAIARRTTSWRLAEWAGASCGVLGVFLPMTTMVFSHSPDRLSYQFGSLLMMLFVTAIQRVRFYPAVVALVAMNAIQATTTYASGIFDARAYQANILFFLTGTTLMLLTSYLLERDDRRVFLLALRGRLLNAQIVESARRDSLTGLFNRKYLDEVTQALWATSHPRPVSVIMIDLDHFKLFNDSYGHVPGDACLRAITGVIGAMTDGQTAYAVRFGGEEVLILMPDADRTAALGMAEAIRTAIRTCAIPHPARGKGAIVTASFGVASILAPAASASELIAAADAALYAAKHAGRDCIWPQGGRAEEPPAVGRNRSA